MNGRVLVLGATGKFGHHAARAFAAAGWSVQGFDRARGDLDAALAGMDVVVMGWNPPGYQNWAADLVPMHRRVAAASARAGVTAILPGNVYVFGPRAPLPWGPDTPHLAENPLGRLRIAVEAAWRDAGGRTILLRCGDFIDDTASGTWFDRFIAKPLARGRIAYPGRLDVPHAWAYLPDAGRAAVALAEMRGRLSRFEDVPFPGLTLTGAELALALGRGLGRSIAAGRMPWWPMHLLRPFVPVLGGVFEMRYLWDLAHRLDGSRFEALLAGFAATPADQALAAAVAPPVRTPGTGGKTPAATL